MSFELPSLLEFIRCTVSYNCAHIHHSDDDRTKLFHSVDGIECDDRARSFSQYCWYPMRHVFQQSIINKLYNIFQKKKQFSLLKHSNETVTYNFHYQSCVNFNVIYTQCRIIASINTRFILSKSESVYYSLICRAILITVIISEYSLFFSDFD